MSSNPDHDVSPSSAPVAEQAEIPDSRAGGCVSPRRMKKRELDRKCQRMARDRTKNHIAYLEKLVEDFRQQDTNRHIAVLMGQLSDLRKERDALARSLDSIAKLAKNSQTSESGGGRSPGIERSANSGQRGSHNINTPPDTTTSNLNISVPHQTQDLFQDDPAIPNDMGTPFEPARLNQSSYLALEASSIDVSSGAYSGPFDSSACTAIVTGSCQTWDPIIPRTQTICECSITTQVAINYGRKNLWRFANEVLTATAMAKSMASTTQTQPSSLRDISPAKQRLKDNVPIRAMLEGWDAVADLVNLSPTWQALRRIDEELFAPCAKVERLAIMCLMYLQLESYADPMPQKNTGLPTWYIRRPSQSTIAHSYAIDFFAWPGLRERFVFSQHRYCANIFWDLFCTSFRLLWPFEFRDCYTRNTQTGLFQISSTFDQRIRDIQSWVMGPEMFERFPEFYSDIPTFNHIPGVISEAVWPQTESPEADHETVEAGDDEYTAPDLGQHGVCFFSLDSLTTFSHSYMQQAGPAAGVNFRVPENMNVIGFDGSVAHSF